MNYGMQVVHETISSINLLEIEKSIIITNKIGILIILRQKWGLLWITVQVLGLIINLILEGWIMDLIVKIWVHTQLMHYFFMNVSNNSISTTISY